MSLLISLVPGWGNHAPSHYQRLIVRASQHMESKGINGWIHLPALDMLHTPAESLAKGFREEMDDLIAELRPTNSVVVGHSTGGLVARPWVRAAVARGVRVRAVWVGVPWRGTPSAWFAIGATARSIRPGIPREDLDPLPGTDEVVLVAEHDLIVPESSASALRLPVKRVPVDHGGLVWRRDGVDAIVAAAFSEPRAR